MIKKLLFISLLTVICAGVYAQDKTVTFTFKAGYAMFYGREVPNNSVKLQELFDYLDANRRTIDQAGIRINIDAYSTSGGSERANKGLSFIRANRVKSELIDRKGLKEDNFTRII